MNSIFTVTDTENYHVISFIEDELTLVKSTQFMTDLQSELLDDNDRSLIFDLRNVRYADSSFLGKLIVINKKLKIDKKFMALVNMNDEFYQVVKLAQLDKLFIIRPDIQSAVAHLNELFIKNMVS